MIDLHEARERLVGTDEYLALCGALAPASRDDRGMRAATRDSRWRVPRARPDPDVAWIVRSNRGEARLARLL